MHSWGSCTLWLFITKLKSQLWDIWCCFPPHSIRAPTFNGLRDYSIEIKSLIRQVGLCQISLTSPTAFDRMWTIFSWGVATTLWLLISIMRWPTLTPPRSAIPPRIRLQICDGNPSSQIRLPRFYTWEQNTTHNPILDAKAQLVAQVRSPDEDCGHRGASDDVQLDAGLVLQSLHEESRWNRWEAEAWSPAFCDYGFNSLECSSWVWWKVSRHVLCGHLQIKWFIWSSVVSLSQLSTVNWPWWCSGRWIVVIPLNWSHWLTWSGLQCSVYQTVLLAQHASCWQWWQWARLSPTHSPRWPHPESPPWPSQLKPESRVAMETEIKLLIDG